MCSSVLLYHALHAHAQKCNLLYLAIYIGVLHIVVLVACYSITEVLFFHVHLHYLTHANTIIDRQKVLPLTIEKLGRPICRAAALLRYGWRISQVFRKTTCVVAYKCKQCSRKAINVFQIVQFSGVPTGRFMGPYVLFVLFMT